MTEHGTIQYKVGDVVNGHILGTDNQWRPVPSEFAPMPPGPNTSGNGKLIGLIAGGAAAVLLVLGAIAVGTSDSTAPTESASNTTAEESAGLSADSQNTVPADTEPVLAKDNPSVGQTVTVGDWQFVINEVDTDANSEIAATNQFNEDPTNQYVMVTYTATYIGDEATADAYMDIYFSFAGSDNVVYDEASVVTPKDSQDAPTEVRSGGTVTYQVVFDVPASAISGGTIIVENSRDTVEFNL